MPDVKNTINGLQQAIDIMRRIMPNQYWFDIETPCNDAIALLKAQEPRVMTATEAYTADYVYIEFDGVITPAIRTTNERDGHRESYFATQQLGGDWMRWDDYGITWRCWTSRPTDEQREAAPWDKR